MVNRRRPGLLGYFLVLLLPGPALAWGDLGHRIICEIAFQELNGTARERVKQLIQRDPQFDTFRVLRLARPSPAPSDRALRQPIPPCRRARRRPRRLAANLADVLAVALGALSIAPRRAYLGAMRKNTEKELKAAVQAAEAELTGATKLSAVNAAARKLMRAKEALKRFQSESQSLLFTARHPVRLERRPRLERSRFLVDLIAGLLEVADDALGELLPGVVRHVLAQDAAHQGALAAERQAEREHEVLAEAPRVAHGKCSCFVRLPVARRGAAVKPSLLGLRSCCWPRRRWRNASPARSRACPLLDTKGLLSVLRQKTRRQRAIAA
jgi:hypothetical protein